MKEFLKEAVSVLPSKRQIEWFNIGYYAFIHFGPNTYTGREWGTGDEPESIFNPTELDCDQWVESVKSAGMKGLIITAKHHDGFCLWPSKYTEHSVKNSPCKKDIVKEASEACKRGGIKFGFYLSPWDRNSKLYGTDEYNDYYCNQLTELLTQYGDIFCIWFDNACGEGPNGKKQNYDFKRYIELVRKYQPNAVIFNDFGPDIRWCGNEEGLGRKAEWSVIPKELCKYSKVQTGPAPFSLNSDLSYLRNNTQKLGTLDTIMLSEGLTFTPAEIDVSIRPGWFWHESEEPHSLERLLSIYIQSVGNNTSLNLNLPPDKNGLIDERDVARLKEFGDLLKKEFGNVVSSSVKSVSTTCDYQSKYEIVFEKSETEIKYIELREDLEKGQRVESFQILAVLPDGGFRAIYQGDTIGNRKICEIRTSFKEQVIEAKKMGEEFDVNKLILLINARGETHLKDVIVYS